MRVILALTLLLYASVRDIKVREVENWPWQVMIVVGLALLGLQYFLVAPLDLFQLALVPLMVGFVYLLYQLYIIYGGADAKALMSLAILFPVYPHIFDVVPHLDFGIFAPQVEMAFPFTFLILLNTTLPLIAIPLVYLFTNLAKGDASFPQALFYLKMDLASTKDKHVWLMQEMENGKLITHKPTLGKRASDIKEDKAQKEMYRGLEDAGVEKVWVDFQLPLLVPMTAGLLISVVLGNFLLAFMFWLRT